MPSAPAVSAPERVTKVEWAFSAKWMFFFSSRRRHTRSVSAFLLNRSSDLSRNATRLNSRFKSLDTLKVKIISVTFRRVIRTNHKKASKIWRHENIQLGGCQS